MLHALYECGIEPDLLVGTSAGALNAAFIASRPQSPATAAQLARIWRGLQREDVFPVSMSALVGGVCGRRDHLVRDHGLRRLVHRYVEFDDLVDASIPLHVVTFDVTEGRELLLSAGPAVDAVAAAASIPGVFPPVRIDERELIDGGVVNNTPISHAVERRRADLRPAHAGPHDDARARRAKRTGRRDLWAGTARRQPATGDVARYAGDAELIVLPVPKTSGVQPTSFEHSTRLIREARAAARATLAPRGAARHLRVATEPGG